MEIELTKENYDGEVIKSNMPVLVTFGLLGADLAKWLRL